MRMPGFREEMIFMKIDWKRLELSDKHVIDSYYRKEQPQNCELTFANNFLWSPFSPISFAEVEDCLVFLVEKDKCSVGFPIGGPDEEAEKKALWELEQYFAEKKKRFRMHLVSEEQFEKLERWFPGKFVIDFDRDLADYLYEGEKLRTLSGKKLHAKRNHINKFLSLYENWQYEEITGANRMECVEMAQEWWERNREEGTEKEMEIRVVLSALQYLEALELKGGLLRVDGSVQAFAIGEPVNEDTFVVHFEKAFSDVEGAYPMINREFVRHAAAGYRYINREDDAGSEGLRKAKLSYYPLKLLQKGTVWKKEEAEALPAGRAAQ